MSTIRKSLIVLFLLFSVNFVAKAQFLGQQSLSESSYVIDQSGNLWAWGDNFYAQLGLGDRVNRNTPTMVPVPAGASKWVLVAGGANFAIAVADSDKLYTWGLNDKGQIGNGAEDGIYAVPTRIQNPLGVTTWKWVSAGADHCEALTTDGRLYAWGDNSKGQLGVGTTEYIITPQLVQFPDGVTAWADVAAGPGYTMMIAQNGLLYACGKDTLDDFEPWEGPIQARVDTFRAYSPLPCIAASYRLDSRIDNEYYETNYFVGPTGGSPETVAAVADGGWHALLLVMDGGIVVAGANTYGQLGLGYADSNVDYASVAFPPGVTQFVAIAAGLKHSLAIGNDGWLYAWGDDSVGELGIGSDSNHTLPVKVFKVCAPLSMSASLSVPNDFKEPYSITLKVKNTSTTTSLTNTDAFLALAGPLTYLDSVPDQPVTSPIAPSATGSATWDGTTIFYGLNESLFPIYFTYIRSANSAPLLVSYYNPQSPILPSPWVFCDGANVVDSLTGLPLAGADLVFPGPPQNDVFSESPFDSDKMVSNAEGDFSLCIRGPVYDLTTPFPVSEYPINLMKENYETQRTTLSEPIPENLTYYLGPSEIQGTFALPAPAFIADSIQKVYYPDSLVGFALSRNVIFRTLDSGISWSAMYVSDADLHDVKFLDLAHGWVVGDAGLILSTTDTGETWQTTHAGTKNLRALTLIGSDTAWAVGDAGTVVERTGNTWTVMPPLSTNDLTSIHFLDPEDGVIGGNGIYYLYNYGTWTRNIINANVRTVYYTQPGQMFFAGTNGSIINYTEGIFSSFTPDYTYTTHTINSLYFLNASTGYAVGDSGSSFVTYDTGASWAPMPEFPNTATSVNFFSLAGHGASDNGVLNYDGEPNVFHAIVRGRVTFGNPQIPILGAEVDRIFVAVVDDTDTVSAFMNNAYTTDQGNFVFTGIDSVFPYEYHIHFMDSGISKTKIFYAVKGHPHEITTLNYNDYTPPPPDTTLVVAAVPESDLSLNVSASESFAQISYSIPTDGPAKLMMQDVLGRTVRMISDGFHSQGISETDVPFDGLVAGAYYVTLETAEGSLTKKFVVIR